MATPRRGKLASALLSVPQFLLIGAARALPHRARLRFGAGLLRCAAALVPDLRARIEGNLKLIFPDLSAEERAALRHATAGNVGRTLVENITSPAFLRRAPWSEPAGPGWPIVREAARAGTGAILVSGHFGQWEAVRGALKARGISCAGLYRPLGNPYLESYYVTTLRAPGPVFPRGGKGFRDLVRHLRAGGVVAVLLDQYVQRGAMIDFLDHPAPSGTAMAELALKYSVPMIPAYGTRRADGVAIDVYFEPPIPPSTPEAMTQAAADSLGARVRAHPAQYYWLHRRWVKRF